jgi:hypothetical protein
MNTLSSDAIAPLQAAGEMRHFEPILLELLRRHEVDLQAFMTTGEGRFTGPLHQKGGYLRIGVGLPPSFPECIMDHRKGRFEATKIRFDGGERISDLANHRAVDHPIMRNETPEQARSRIIACAIDGDRAVVRSNHATYDLGDVEEIRAIKGWIRVVLKEHRRTMIPVVMELAKPAVHDGMDHLPGILRNAGGRSSATVETEMLKVYRRSHQTFYRASVELMAEHASGDPEPRLLWARISSPGLKKADMESILPAMMHGRWNDRDSCLWVPIRPGDEAAFVEDLTSLRSLAMAKDGKAYMGLRLDPAHASDGPSVSMHPILAKAMIDHGVDLSRVDDLPCAAYHVPGSWNGVTPGLPSAYGQRRRHQAMMIPPSFPPTWFDRTREGLRISSMRLGSKGAILREGPEGAVISVPDGRYSPAMGIYVSDILGVPWLNGFKSREIRPKDRGFDMIVDGPARMKVPYAYSLDPIAPRRRDQRPIFQAFVKGMETAMGKGIRKNTKGRCEIVLIQHAVEGRADQDVLGMLKLPSGRNGWTEILRNEPGLDMTWKDDEQGFIFSPDNQDIDRLCRLLLPFAAEFVMIHDSKDPDEDDGDPAHPITKGTTHGSDPEVLRGSDDDRIDHDAKTHHATEFDGIEEPSDPHPMDDDVPDLDEVMEHEKHVLDAHAGSVVRDIEHDAPRSEEAASAATIDGTVEDRRTVTKAMEEEDDVVGRTAMEAILADADAFLRNALRTALRAHLGPLEMDRLAGVASAMRTMARDVMPESSHASRMSALEDVILTELEHATGHHPDT